MVFETTTYSQLSKQDAVDLLMVSIISSREKTSIKYTIDEKYNATVIPNGF